MRTITMNLSRRLSSERILHDTAMLIRLERYTDLLLEWGITHNLTGAKTPEAIQENIVDSLYPTTFIDAPSSLLDIGTGAGFPGLILAMAYPDVPVVLSEPRQKRAGFLRYAVMELELSRVQVRDVRVETLTHTPFGLITSRAVTDIRLLLELTLAVADDTTQYLFYKGSRAPEELDALTHKPNYDIVQWNKRNFVWIK